MQFVPSIDATAYRANLQRSIPLVLAVPVVYAVVLLAVGVPFDPLAFLAGVVGWIVALALRAPVALLSLRALGSHQRAQPVITAASGPAEELVRLVVLLVVGSALPQALWIGLGWGAIEVVYSIANGFAILGLLGRDDPAAQQARTLLPMAGALRPDAPLWGAVERGWATLLHIGFTVLIAAAPVLVLLAIVLHSATNLTLVRFGDRLGLARTQLAGIVWTAVVLAVAAVAWSAFRG